MSQREISELRQRVEKLERQVAFLSEQLGLQYRDEQDDEVSSEIQELIRRGKEIAAIKLYREQTGVGLRAAKEYIDSLAR